MAWTDNANGGNATDKTGTHPLQHTLTSAIAVDDLIVVVCTVDSTSGGSIVNAPSDTLGNTYVEVGKVESGNAGNTVDVVMYYSVVTAAGTPTISWSAAGTFTASAMSTRSFSPGSGNTAELVVATVNTSGVTASTNPSVTTASNPASGDLVVAVAAWEGPDSNISTDDSDTSNGSWSSRFLSGTAGGSATTNASLTTQYKITTGAGAQTFNPTLTTSRDWCCVIAAFREVAGSSDLSVDSEAAVGAQARAGGANPSITGSSKALVGVVDRAGATRDYTVDSRTQVGMVARAGATRDYSVGSRTQVGILPSAQPAGPETIVSASLSVGVSALAGGRPEPNADSRTFAAHTRTALPRPEPNAATTAKVGVRPRSQPTIDVSAVGDAFVGTFPWAFPVGDDPVVAATILVGVTVRSPGALFNTSHIPLCYIRTGPWSYSGGATASALADTKTLVGVSSRSAVQGDDFVVSCSVGVGVAPRSLATVELTSTTNRSYVGALARSGGALPSISFTGRSLVGAAARAPAPSISIQAVSRTHAAHTRCALPRYNPDVNATARIGILVYRSPFTITGSAAIVLNRMIALGYGSVPISQELVNRRKQRGGMEPPTRPAERRDFFDVRRGNTEAWIAPTLLNSWVEWGLGQADPGYRKEGDKVYLRGLVKSGTVGLATPIFQLPEGYRPSGQLIFAVLSNDALGQVRVSANGDVLALTPSSNIWVSLDTVSFSVTA